MDAGADAPLPPRDREREPVFWARFYSPDQIPEGESFAKLLLPVERITPALIERFGERLVGELPAVLWPEDESAMEKKLAALRSAGLRELWGENIYAIPLARRLDMGLRGGAGLNILNSRALRHYEAEGLLSLTASIELSMKEIKALSGGAPLGIMAYGYLPLMRFRNCPERARLGCAVCGGKGALDDRRGKRFALECGEKKYSSLLNSVPLHIAERDLRGLDFALLYFTRESAQRCAAVAEEYRLGRKSAGERTSGLYYRELL